MREDLVVDLERNAWSMFSFMGRGPGGRVTDSPTRLVIESPVQRPPYNGVWRFYDEGGRTVQQQAEELLAPLTARGVTPLWVVHPTTDPGIREALTALGMACAEEVFGMCADLADIGEPPPVPDGVDVIEMSVDDSRPWMELVSWRYGLAEESSAYLRDAYRAALERGTRGWLALIEGQPVSKAVLHVDDGVAGIYGVATTPEGRNRGLATLLCTTAVEAARADGASRTVLHSTPMARSLYRRMGYRDVATFEMWAAPDTLHL
jgi:ribosomal protein S18 acetylase RimI-like enzyme